MTEQTTTAEGLTYAYNKIANFLELREADKAGMTVLITKHWILVALIEKPYHTTAKQMPCYLDGFAYAGLFKI